MQALKTFNIYRRLMKNQWLNHNRIREIQESKLRRVIREAYNNVPFYNRLYDEAGISPSNINTLDDLKKIPIITKSDLQESGTESIINNSMDSDRFKSEHSSGSTGRPFSVFFDRAYLCVRNALFLRALRTSGYSIGRRIFLITSLSPDKRSNTWLRWRYGSILDPPELLLEQVNQYRPDFLYGCTTPLRQLAEFVRSTGSAVWHPKTVITTGEMTDALTRGLLEDTFKAEVYNCYGSTEMGMVGLECPGHNGYHMAEDSVIVEYLPVGKGGDSSNLVMTNLDLVSMPFIRFETGDIGVPGGRKACSCGRGFSMLERIEGRIVDYIHLKDGQIISPYRITCTLENIRGLKRYQVIQDDFDKFTVRVETTKNCTPVIDEEISRYIKAILGKEIMVTVLKKDRIHTEPGRKFRVVESRLKEHK